METVTEHLDGIAIHSPYAEHYLEVLAGAIANQFADDPRYRGFATALEQRLGFASPPLDPDQLRRVDLESMPYTIGWFHHRRLEQLVHREWLLAPTNEFAAFEPVFDQLDYLASAKRMFLAGAGVCRMAEYLLVRHQATLEQVTCADLSFFVLDCGRLLMQNRGVDMPAALRRERKLIEVVDGTKLRPYVAPLEYVVAPNPATCPVRYMVVDACSGAHGHTDIEAYQQADLICSPFLLDAHPHFGIMLVRMCEALRVGQRMLTLASIAPQRDPSILVAMLETCGLRIDSIRIDDLPYSFERHDCGYSRTISPTLIVEAEKVEPGRFDRIAVAPTHDFPRLQALARQAILPTQRHFPVEIDTAVGNALAAGFRRQRYSELARIARDQLGLEPAERVLTWLASRCFVRAALRAS